MAQKRLQDTPAPLFETSSQCLIEAPPWTATAAVVLRAMRVGRVWTSLLERVRVARGRAGVFVAIDYALLLVLFALSPAPHLKALDATLGPVARVYTALWERVVSDNYFGSSSGSVLFPQRHGLWHSELRHNLREVHDAGLRRLGWGAPARGW